MSFNITFGAYVRSNNGCDVKFEETEAAAEGESVLDAVIPAGTFDIGDYVSEITDIDALLIIFDPISGTSGFVFNLDGLGDTTLQVQRLMLSRQKAGSPLSMTITTTVQGRLRIAAVGNTP